MIDLHCHILPGLDDGSPSLDVSLAMARRASQDGITDIVATPHLFRGESRLPDFGLISKKKSELQSALEKEGIPLTIHGGVEARFSHNILEEIKKHRPHLVLAGSSYMFVEFPFEYVYPGVKEVFFQVMNEGIVPIIAHPERITDFMHHPEMLYDLVEMGALVQANAGSFSGRSGGEVRQAAIRFLNLNLIHFIATDAHDLEHRPPVLSDAARTVADIVGAEAATSFVQDNPRAVLDDAPPPYQPDPINPRAAPEKHMRFRIPSIFKPRKPDRKPDE
jgi:protein-tyrosine phosphatase